MALKLITAPATEPITLDEAKAHLRVVGDDEDALITALIAAARQGAEHITGRALMPQVWELVLDEFECTINLPKPPLVAVASVKYVDTNGVLQALDESAYQVDADSVPARVMPAYGASWPSTRCQPNAVRIQFQCGYADAAAVPQEIKTWMLLRISALYENRDAVNVGNIVTEFPYVERLLDAYRVWVA